MSPIQTPYERCLRYSMYCMFLILVTGCQPAGTSDVEPVSVCCKTKDGATSLMTNHECKDLHGILVALDLCEEAPPVSLCCDVDGVFSLMTNKECHNAPGAPVDIADCDDVCCSIDNDPNTMITQGECDSQAGTVFPISDCEIAEEVCCNTPQGPMWTPALGCHDGMILPDSDCELTEDVCCKTDLGNIWVPADQCDPSQLQPIENCPDVCCETSTGVMFVPAGQCDPAQTLPLEACDPVVEDVCCKTDQGNIWIPADQCDPSQVQPVEACPDVCCETPNGVMMLPADQCPAPQVLPLDVCEPQEDVCCETPNGVMMLPADQCPAPQVLPLDVCEPQEDVCCETPNGVMMLPADQCPAPQVLPLDFCEPQEDVCCETANGAVMLPADQCPTPQVLPLDFCEPQEDVCCETTNGAVMLPADQCPTPQVLPLDFCEPQEDVCCETPNGAVMLPADQCPTPQVLPLDFCEPQEDVCCETANGVMLVPANQCPVGNILPMSECEEPPVAMECVAFEAFDMGTMPVMLNTGVSLINYIGTGPYSGAIPASTGCSSVPPNALRAHAGVGSDGVMVFDAPITDFFILQLNVQVGDELTISPSATSTEMTSCMPGGFAGNAYHHVVLDNPTTTVNIQDVNPGGGSGYSFLLAQCTEWVAVEPVEDVCCETPNGLMILPSNQCPVGSVLPMTSCEEPEPLGDCVAFQAIDMGNLPYTLNTGVTLQSFTGWGIFPVQNFPSNGCSTIPNAAQRAHVGMDMDGTVTFDTPVSDFYILTMYSNDPGDELNILEPSVLNQQTCDPGGIDLDAYVHVVLDTPSTTVTVQDLSPDGGSGYSFMIAECIEWAPATEPLVCCKNPNNAGPEWVTQAACDAAGSSVNPPEVCGPMN